MKDRRSPLVGYCRRAAAGLFMASAILSPAPLAAQQSMLIEQHKNILALTQGSWLHFRDFNGRQLVYFTHLEVYRCAISKVLYSFNNEKLNQSWDLAPCDPDNPHEIDPEAHPPYLSLPPNTAQWAAVQLIFLDNSRSKIVRIDAPK